MALGAKLEIRQSQQLAMTPQLRQAIALLQMSSLEMSAFVAREVEENPLLSLDEGERDPLPAVPEALPGGGEEAGVDQQMRAAGPEDSLKALDGGGENLFSSAERTIPDADRRFAPAGGIGSAGHANGQASDGSWIEETVRDQSTLGEALFHQIGMMSASPALCLLARRVVGELDDSGYLRADLGSLAARLGVPLRMMEEALALIQRCEPVGVGARDLAECLALQLRSNGRLDPAMASLLARLGDVAALRYDTLLAACDVDMDDLLEMIAEIKALDPHPGMSFAPGLVDAVTPDVLLSRAPTGDWALEINPDTLPRVLCDRNFTARIGAGGDAAAERFITDCRQKADWLLRALEQRASTILKVSGEIVRRQHRFFAEGVSALSPMTLREVAEAIGMHESTVSRVTANKYLSCDRGVFEMKYFFTRAIVSDEGAVFSAESVRHQIKVLIGKEDSRNTLSDDEIVRVLKEGGIKIARRTVAKYREGMNIPSSARRKRLNVSPPVSSGRGVTGPGRRVDTGEGRP